MPALEFARLTAVARHCSKKSAGLPCSTHALHKPCARHRILCMAALKPVAVISGAARAHGIGRGCADAFLQAGYQVVGLDNQAEEKPIQNNDFQFHNVDITSTEQIQGLAEVLHKLKQGITVLINNAGIADPYMPQGAVERVSHWNRVIQTNLTGAYLLSEALLPYLIPGRSAIIHMSSIRAKQSEANTEAYGAAKAGLIGLTHAQAVSLAHKTRVNTVLPGWIDTVGKPEDITQEDHDWHLTGRVGLPDNIAQMCLFLADHDKSRFITGQEFLVDGGVGKKLIYPEES